MSDGLDSRLTRMETKLDMALDEVRAIGRDHEARLRSLERRTWVAIGFAAASLTGVGAQLLTSLGGA